VRSEEELNEQHQQQRAKESDRQHSAKGNMLCSRNGKIKLRRPIVTTGQRLLPFCSYPVSRFESKNRSL
jgi:hypothetical protein